jgi:glycosyltransferase involved in cell wall biosynthesis
MSGKKAKIIQHVFGKSNTGGPVVALSKVIENKLLDNFDFNIIKQSEAAGGINLKLIWRFYNEIKYISPSLIHVRGLGNEGFHGVVAAKLARVPNILISVHGTMRDLRYPSSKIKTSIIFRILEPISLYLATHIVSVCDYAAKRSFIQKYKSKFIGVIPNGASLPKVGSFDLDKYRSEFFIKSTDVVGVCVSRITREKGYFTLLDSLKLLNPSNENFKLIIVGDGPDRIELQESFDKLNFRVQFLGLRSDVSEILSVSDFFIFPSLHENMSNALLEAMSHKLAVIATNVGGNTEVVSKGGGILIPPNAPVDLANAIDIYINNKGRRIIDGEKALSNIQKNYTIDNTAQILRDTYDKILNIK